MRMPEKAKNRTTKLTAKVIDAAKPEAKRYVIWDTEKKGFGLRVETTGLKSFIVRYRLGQGGRNAPRREIVIGRFGNWTADAARKEAGSVLNAVDAGRDPASERDRKRKELTISELCDRYLKDGTGHKKASTLKIDVGRIERHIKPLLGKRMVSEVDQADIRKFMRDIASGKTAADVKTGYRGRAIVEGGKGTASRTVGFLGGIFSFAVHEKLRTDNPVRGVKRYADNKGQRFLSGSELNALGDAIRTIEAEGGNKIALAIIRLLAFTGARKSEITCVKWPEIDFERQCLRLGDSKTGAKVIPLGPPALTIFAATERREGSEWVFPAESGDGTFQGTEKVWYKVRTNAGMPQLRMHDLRHSFASMGLAAGDNLAVIGKLLGHSDVKTTSRYAHLADDPVKQAAARISGSIAAALDGYNGDVVKLRKT